MAYNPMTELEAVNAMLYIIGEQPVATLEESGVAEVTLAHTALIETSNEVQSRGLHCNTERAYTLLPDSDGKVRIPNNTIHVDPTNPYEDFVKRGQYLYDRAEHTFILNRKVKVDITWFLPFEDLPQSVRKYITVKAARDFILHRYGESELYQITERMELEALVEFKRNLLRSQDGNMLDYNPGYTIGRRRRRF